MIDRNSCTCCAWLINGLWFSDEGRSFNFCPYCGRKLDEI